MGTPPGWQPPPYQPPPPIDASQLRPRRLWYWLSPIPAAIGIGAAILFIIALIDRIDPNLDHFTTARPAVVQLEKGHDRSIYVQVRGSANAAYGNEFAVSCDVRDAVTESKLPLDEPSSSFTLTIGNDEYRERFHFDPPRTARYNVDCDGPPNAPLAVGPHIGFRGLLVPIVGALLSFLIGIALTVTTAVMTGVKRSSHKARLQHEALQRTWPPSA